MAVGQFIDPVTVSISSKTALEYCHFAKNVIIYKDKSDWPKDRLFIDDLQDVLMERSNVMPSTNVLQSNFTISHPHRKKYMPINYCLPSASKYQMVNWLPINLIPWTCVLIL